jgi:L-fuconolactonase
VINTHVHFIDPRRVHYPWLDDPIVAPINRPFLPEDLSPMLETNGIKAAILVQTRSSLEESKEFLTHAQAHPWLAGVVVWADLTATDLEAQFEALRATPGGNKLVGIRHQVQDDHWLLRQDVQRGLAVLDDHNLTFDLLVKPQQLESAIQTVRNLTTESGCNAARLEWWHGVLTETCGV